MHIIKTLFIAFLLNQFSLTTSAHPDVFFADSQDAYLEHELSGKNIRFRMSNGAVDSVTPERAYDFEALNNYMKNEYQFENKKLKAEFLDMFEISFESKYSMAPFLNELIRLLERFASAYPHHVHR